MARTTLRVSLVATLSVLALAACAPPSDDKDSGDSGGGGDAATATSAEDSGGMDELVAAAEEEGELNVIALPPDWANYGEIIKAFSAKYDIKVNSAAARRRQPGRDRRGQAAQGQPTAPRTCSTSASRSRWPTPTCSRPYKVQTWDDIPDARQGPERRSGSTTTAATCRSATTPTRCPSRRSLEDLLGPDYKGKVALNGDPTSAGSGLRRRDDGVARQRRVAPTTSLPASTTSSKLNKAGNLVPVDPTPATIESGQTPVVIDWDYLNAAETKALPTWKVMVPEDASSVATTSRPSTPTRRTRPPPGCGRSSSTPTRARTSGSPAAPVRSAPTRWSRPGTIDQARTTRCRRSAVTPVIPTDRADREGRASTWPRTGPRRSADRRTVRG